MDGTRTLVAALVIYGLVAGCMGNTGSPHYQIEADTIGYTPPNATVLDANSSRVRDAETLREVVVESVESNGRASQNLIEQSRYETVREEAQALPHRTESDDFYDDDLVHVYVEYRGEIVRVTVSTHTGE